MKSRDWFILAVFIIVGVGFYLVVRDKLGPHVPEVFDEPTPATATAEPEAAPAGGAVAEFLELLRAERYEEAWELVDPAHRDAAGWDGIVEGLRANPSILRSAGFEPDVSAGDATRVEGTLLFDDAPGVPCTIATTVIDGRTLVTGLSVGGATLLPPPE